MAPPLISVITPTYNRAAYLGQAIESVLTQSYPNVELHVIDDGSTDETPALMERYLGDDRVHYHRQSRQGPSVARNTGLARSRGEYICFLDSDDIWLPGKLEESLAAFAADHQAGVVYADYILIDAAGREFSRRNMRRYSGDVTAALLRDNFVSMNTTMVRSELVREVGGFAPEDGLAEDYGLWLRVATRARFRYVPRFWTCYRVMDDQLSSDKLARLEANVTVVRRFLGEYGEAVTRRQRRLGWCALRVRSARHYSAAGRPGAALVSAFRALALRPLARGPWRCLGRIALDRLPKRW